MDGMVTISPDKPPCFTYMTVQLFIVLAKLTNEGDFGRDKSPKNRGYSEDISAYELILIFFPAVCS